MAAAGCPGELIPVTARTVRTLALIAALVIAIVSACAPAVGANADPAASPATSEPLECTTVGYPCAWSDVAPTVADRSRALAAEASTKVGDDADMAAAAAWLESQDGVTSVSTGDGVIRFLLDGGRPTWVSAGSKGSEAATTASLDRHLASAAGTPGAGLADERSGPTTDALVPPLLNVVGEDSETKTATVLAPFGYYESMEAGEIAAILGQTRGYEGRVTYLENVAPESNNVTIDTFANLDGNDVLYIDSFGGTTNPNEREPAHGFIAVNLVNEDFHITDAQDVGLDIVRLEGGIEVLAVTADFFRGLYPGGFQNTLIFLNVDRLTDETLIRAIKGGTSELYAWNGGIDPTLARKVITPYLEDLAATGRSTAVVYHEMVDRMRVLDVRFVGYNPISKAGMRIRETPWLRDPADGGPLADGGEITILTELGDDKPDTVSWIVDIDGVDVDTAEPEHTSMVLYINTLEAASPIVSELKQIDQHIFQAEGQFELPYDLDEGDQITLEAVVNLPEGGASRHTVKVDVIDEPRPDIGTVWKGEASVTSNTIWDGVTITKTATIEFTRDPDEEVDAKKVTFNVTAGSMTWTLAGGNDKCSYDSGAVSVPLGQGDDAGGLTFDLREPGIVTYFGDAGARDGRETLVAVDCHGDDRSFVTRADGNVWNAPMELVWVMDGPTISGTYRMDTEITGTYTWTFTKVK
jgi:hypothetical protein